MKFGGGGGGAGMGPRQVVNLMALRRAGAIDDKQFAGAITGAIAGKEIKPGPTAPESTDPDMIAARRRRAARTAVGSSGGDETYSRTTLG